jgi:hypothetical protein
MPKDKITDKQFVLVINGPSCGGKSSVSDILFGKYGGIFKAKFDALKWLISDYDPKVHRPVVHDMVIETIRTALGHGLSVIKEGAFQEKVTYAELAAAAGASLYTANIEAPWDVLTARFQARIEAKKEGARIANTDPVRFKELYDMYEEAKSPTELVFDSSKQNPEEIAETIATYIRTH